MTYTTATISNKVTEIREKTLARMWRHHNALISCIDYHKLDHRVRQERDGQIARSLRRILILTSVDDDD